MKLTLINVLTENEIEIDGKQPTILGRGLLFDCFDKRVSRRHGSLQLSSDGDVILIALHHNPCFVMKNGLPPIHQLEKNEQKILNDGDYLGFLPDSFWYRVVVEECGNHSTSVEDSGSSDVNHKIASNDIKIKIANHNIPKANDTTCRNDADCTANTENSEVQNISNSSPTLTSDCDNKAIIEDKKNTFPKNESSNTTVCSFGDLEKTCKLPLWMYEIDDFPGEATEVGLKQDAISKNSQAEENLHNNMNSVECHTGSNEETHPNISSELLNQSSPSNPCARDLDMVVQGSSLIKSKSENSLQISNEDVNASKTSSSDSRPICQYDRNCYRKNEQHKKEFAHPGDEDYVPYERRPICEYGASCYRKNPTHRVQYQHPMSNISVGANATPSPPKRKRQAKKTVTNFSSEEDDIDFEDPFANDATSDEYVPSDFNSEDEIEETDASSAADSDTSYKKRKMQ